MATSPLTTPGGTELLELEVGAVAAGGGCVARAPDGRVVFVRHSLPGERVIARVTATTSSFLRADAVEILTPSVDRVSPPCPHAGPGRCGGCDFQHVEQGAQRRLKAFRVAEQLARVAGIERTVAVEPVDGDAGGLHWRTRVRLAADKEGAVGFRKHRSHELERVDDCPVAAPTVAATGALAARWRGVSELEVVTGSGAGEALIAVTPHGRGAPRLPEGDLGPGVGLVVRRKVVRPPGAVHAGTRAHLSHLGGRLLAGPRRRRGRAARCGPRRGRRLPWCARRRPVCRCRALLRAAGRGGGPRRRRPRSRARPPRLRRPRGTTAPRSPTWR